MNTTTSIEWTEATWNPVTGCTKVSLGCDHCYAERITHRFGGDFAQVTLHEDRLEQPLRWRRPRMVFVNSMSDLFHEKVPDWFIARVFAVMHDADGHTFQILTKRHARMRSLLGSQGFYELIVGELAWQRRAWQGYGNPQATWPLPNVWLGVSTENQQWAEIRIPPLLETPAAVRYVSAEPLLEDITLTCLRRGSARVNALAGDVANPCDGAVYAAAPASLDWIITGGESGPHARPTHPDWVRRLRDQSRRHGAAFLHKQWGEWWPGIPSDEAVWPRARRHNWPDGEVTSYRIGRRHAGRVLDSETLHEFPPGLGPRV